jgi:GT2 family glycosyltransferase
MQTVTIIVLGYNSKSHLEACFRSLHQMESGSLAVEFLFVDNASSDGSAAWIREHFPGVQVVENAANLGFCGGNNVGAREARTEWIAFLNPDMRVSPDWLTELFQVARRDPDVDCIASRIMNWDGSLVDFGGSAMNFYGYGMQQGIGAAPSAASLEERPVLFPCGGAMLIRRDVFLKAGGFDEDYFAFFEDMDLGWRLWVLGYRVVYAGQAVVFHHHHGSWGAVPQRQRQKMYERNTLASILKNYEDETLHQVLPGALFLMGYRAFLTSGLDPDEYRPEGLALGPKPPGFYLQLREGLAFYGKRIWETLFHEGPAGLVRRSVDEIERRLDAWRRRLAQLPHNEPSVSMLPVQNWEGTLLPDRTRAYFEAAQSLLDIYDQVMAKRRTIQAARQRSDQEILPLFREPLTPNYPDAVYSRAVHIVSDLWSLYDLFL